jgi:prepilin-type N-terminal cleavage/methylation domain-containing protein
VDASTPDHVRRGDRGLDQRGFTLAEVLVALSIATVGLTAMAAGLQQATALLETGRQQTIALFLAQQRLEQAKAAALWNFDGLASPSFPAEDPVAGYPAYRRTVDITPTAGVADAVRVKVTVAYRSIAAAPGSPRERTVTLSTVMSRRR